MTQTQGAIARDTDLEAVIGVLDDLPPGRVYAGLNDDWQKAVDLLPFNSVRIPDVLNFEGLPRMAKPYASLSLDGDVAFSFDTTDRGQWDLFNVRYAIARSGQIVPAFLTPLRTIGRYTLYSAPTTGWSTFALTYLTRSVATDSELFFDLRDSIVPERTANHIFTRYTYPAPTTTPTTQTKIARCYTDRRVSYERMQTDRYDALLGCDSGTSLVVLKITYHPNWRVTVDDVPVETFMTSPGFLGFEVPTGTHFVTARYLSTPIKTPLLALGALAALALVVFWRRVARLPFLA